MRAIGLAALFLALASPLAAQDGPSRTFTGQDLFGISVAGDPQISPDGRRIAYVRRSADVMTDRMRPTIWLVDVGTGAEEPLVAGPGSHMSPRWSPDGKRLAYVSTAEGGAPQLYVRWMDSGEAARLTGLPNSPTGLTWSPDGRTIAYAMIVPDEGPKLGAAPANKPEGAQWAPPLEIIDRVTFRADGAGDLKPGFSHVFTIPATGGAPRQLTFGTFNHDGGLDFTPDSRALIVGGNRNEGWQREARESELFRIDLSSGTLRAITSRKGPDFRPVVSPDGRMIAWLGNDDIGKAFASTLLYVGNADGTGARLLAPGLDRGIDALEWSADSRSLLIKYDDDGKGRLARIGLDGSVRPITDALAGGSLDRPYTGGEFSAADNGSIAFTTGDVDTPGDVAVIAGGRTRVLTDLNAQLRAKDLGQVREIAVTAPDGLRVPAWLLTPPGYVEGTKVPTILEIHGGPATAYGPYFATDYQLYAAAGYAVLYTNPRGSTSYGQAFTDHIERAYPGKDHDDLMAAVDAAVAAGIADPDNLFITGGSGGGVLTAWAIGKTDRFKAAAVQKPVINMVSQVLVADNPAYFGPYWFGQMPWEAPEAYWARSPLSLVGNVKTPTIVVVGTEDRRTPPVEAEQYYAALQAREVPTALVRVPGASHSITARPSQSAARASAIIAWFDKYRTK
ncbi:Prolyl tripeptidyl peptidase precursor [Tsuneonella dongtanensis]|uniref:Prolyl tripeptidyl peptidase n=1 Tax=Tsuneonella dongtanensis TaxID=692370 RepID=A0A1B2A9Z4_9SPHN|nr:S9 family peptidase [Tsuneonella dongtanensis]ANY18980.1 Prolyl tripeptidyl peptidase precursor [Tsuneonella dongtanensis]